MCLLFGLTSRHNLPGSREHAPGNALDSFLQRRLENIEKSKNISTSTAFDDCSSKIHGIDPYSL